MEYFSALLATLICVAVLLRSCGDRIANVQTNQKNPRRRDHPVKLVIIKKVEVFR
jgi:hypothetical protein